MKHTDILAAMISPLCSWYEQNKRILPWRKNRDPYRIWVSEIMLQQTRVEAALPYYERFLEALPTVFDLAKAPEEQLLKLWEGLGYYSRVKNMQRAARTVAETYDGAFPQAAGLLEKLPGIGSYTAGAIASIAFNLPEPAVDGNVLRVAARLCDNDEDILLPQTKKRVEEELRQVYHLAQDAGDLTQGIMELGALVCIPGTPKCEVCPLAGLCLAKKNGTADRLPVRKARTEKKTEKRTIFLLLSGGRVALCRRGKKGPLSGMWEFPAVEKLLRRKAAQTALLDMGISAEIRPFIKSRHVFTHLIWEMQSYIAETESQNPDFTWFTPAELEEEVPLPSAMKPFYEALQREAPFKDWR
ncbi:MAG: A/G-specific adenine glycosylase [Ruminococcaceae bacterium]|nr:A/G-specific adenine glycosylase [Oscillospiraceae bacterium]